MNEVLSVGGSFLFLAIGWYLGKRLFPRKPWRDRRWITKDGSVVIGTEKPKDAKRETRL